MEVGVETVIKTADWKCWSGAEMGVRSLYLNTLNQQTFQYFLGHHFLPVPICDFPHGNRKLLPFGDVLTGPTIPHPPRAQMFHTIALRT